MLNDSQDKALFRFPPVFATLAVGAFVLERPVRILSLHASLIILRLN